MKRRNQRASVTFLVVILTSVTFFSGQILCVEANGQIQRLYTPCCLAAKALQSEPGVALVAQTSSGSSCSWCLCIPVVMTVLSQNQTRADLVPDPITASVAALALVAAVNRSVTEHLADSRNQSPLSLLQKRSIVLLI